MVVRATTGRGPVEEPVLLIDLQTWRGVASHFNRDTPLDSFLYDAMGGLIVFVTVVCTDLTVRLWRRPPAGIPGQPPVNTPGPPRPRGSVPKAVNGPPDAPRPPAETRAPPN